MEKRLERNQSLLCCFINYKKAFISVGQEGLWKAMNFFGYLSKYIKLLQALYQQSSSAVRVNGELSDWFKTTVGVHQGCPLSPQLFNILLEAVMLYAIHDTKIGIRVQGRLINNLRFADDIVLIADNDRDLQTIVDLVHQSSLNLRLKINITKTEVQAICTQPQLSNINGGGEQLKQVDKFTYLGGTISQTGSCTEEVQHRIGKAIGAFQALKKIWASKDIRCSTKVELYKVLVLSILLYGAETWTLKKVDEIDFTLLRWHASGESWV